MKINKIGCLFEIGNQKRLTFHYQEHHIQLKNLVVDSKVYGDVEFLNNDNGKNRQFY
jgi:hypothetical protein